jgi:hypothetical protein
MENACQSDDPCTSRPWASVFIDHCVCCLAVIVMYKIHNKVKVWEELN